MTRLLVAAAWLVAGCRADGSPGSVTEVPARYVDAVLCLGCHPAEAARWRGSHHERAPQVATPSSVQGDFGGAAIEDTRRQEGEGGCRPASRRRGSRGWRRWKRW